MYIYEGVRVWLIIEEALDCTNLIRVALRVYARPPMCTTPSLPPHPAAADETRRAAAVVQPAAAAIIIGATQRCLLKASPLHGQPSRPRPRLPSFPPSLPLQLDQYYWCRRVNQRGEIEGEGWATDCRRRVWAKEGRRSQRGTGLNRMQLSLTTRLTTALIYIPPQKHCTHTNTRKQTRTYNHTHTHTHTHIHTHTWTRTHTHIRTHSYIETLEQILCIHTHIFIKNIHNRTTYINKQFLMWKIHKNILSSWKDTIIILRRAV